MEIKIIEYIFPTIGEAGATSSPEYEEGKDDPNILFLEEKMIILME